jgi:hypothetical protein
MPSIVVKVGLRKQHVLPIQEMGYKFFDAFTTSKIVSKL